MKVGLILLLTAAVTAALLMPAQRWIDELEMGTDVLWKGDECFILVRVNTVGWSSSRLGLWASPPEHLRYHAVFVHYDDGKLVLEQVQGLKTLGQLVPYNGRAYLAAGQVTAPPQWYAWNGVGFDALTEAEQQAIEQAYESQSDYAQREGWTERRDVATFDEGEREVVVDLSRATLTMRIVRHDNAGRVSLSLYGDGLAETLYKSPEDAKAVTEEEYSAIADATDPTFRPGRPKDDTP